MKLIDKKLQTAGHAHFRGETYQRQISAKLKFKTAIQTLPSQKTQCVLLPYMPLRTRSGQHNHTVPTPNTARMLCDLVRKVIAGCQR